MGRKPRQLSSSKNPFGGTSNGFGRTTPHDDQWVDAEDVRERQTR